MKLLIRWVQIHDRNVGALRRAGRIAIVVPGLFAIGDKVLDNPSIAVFAGLGAIATLLFVEFDGPRRARLEEQLLLAVSSAAFVCLGTLVSRWSWLAAILMALVTFVVLFSGASSSVLAGAANALLLGFILAASIRGGPSAVPGRLAGWGLACGASLIAIACLWPAPVHDRLRTQAIEACKAIADRLRADASRTGLYSEDKAATARADAGKRADEAVGALHQVFLATPSRPAALGTSARALIRVVDELMWLNGILGMEGALTENCPADKSIAAVRVAAAAVFDEGAAVLRDRRAATASLTHAVTRLRLALEASERRTILEFPHTVTRAKESAEARVRKIVSSLDPSFRAQEVSFATTQIATHIEVAACAETNNVVDRLLERQNSGSTAASSTVRDWMTAYARHSVAVHNSVRAAVVLGLAVLIADLSDVQESFWVILGALAVLRTSALNTGRDATRTLLGTIAGSIVGAAVIETIGTNTYALWIILPVAVFLSGFAPTAISLAAGQGAFTVAILVLFNIVRPAGWHSGIVRVEDVAIGCGVSLIGGLLFWPRGAGPALCRALGEAYEEGSAYFAQAVQFATSRFETCSLPEPFPHHAGTRAAAAARRLDDSFRGFLSERVANVSARAEITSLLTGVVRIRFAADAVLELWAHDTGRGDGDHAHARELLVAGAETEVDWYRSFAGSLVGVGQVPQPLGQDPDLDDRIAIAVSRDLLAADGFATSSAVRLVWTGDHIDSARRLQDALVGPAREIAAYRLLPKGAPADINSDRPDSEPRGNRNRRRAG
jgi:uncharacterized membrane protein YccC